MFRLNYSNKLLVKVLQDSKFEAHLDILWKSVDYKKKKTKKKTIKIYENMKRGTIQDKICMCK